MLARSLIKQGSPTMAGIKTGNLLILDQYSEEEISAFNQMAKDKGIAAAFLGIKNGRTLIYVYRPDLLKKDLDDPLAQRILSSEGYRFNTPKECITCLIDRINNSPSFPHEIGLMLGYPPEDVKGFMENSGSGFKSCGIEGKLAGKKIALFGSYGWGDGEWMRNWEEQCKSLGAVMATDFVICNNEPDDEAKAACEALGKALV